MSKKSDKKKARLNVLAFLFPFASNHYASSARNFFAAETRLANAASVSAQFLVFKPQSGFTHKRSTGTFSAAFFNSVSIHYCVGMFDEWMS